MGGGDGYFLRAVRVVYRVNGIHQAVVLGCVVGGKYKDRIVKKLRKLRKQTTGLYHVGSDWRWL